MTIDATQRKQMTAGMVLAATYKKEEHRAEVVTGEDGRLRYRLTDGTEYTSPSAAGSAVMGGVACNGWRFWRVAGAATQAPGDEPSKSDPPPKVLTAAKRKPKGATAAA
ncbi:MAG: hypothetical protein M0R75_08270 [Dehalococcoidia bacterium]|nr:hypothetical protein [Dehalococcoidia bacterium]